MTLCFPPIGAEVRRWAHILATRLGGGQSLGVAIKLFSNW